MYIVVKGSFLLAAFRILEKQESEILFPFFHSGCYILQTCELHMTGFMKTG